MSKRRKPKGPQHGTQKRNEVKRAAKKAALLTFGDWTHVKRHSVVSLRYYRTRRRRDRLSRQSG